MTARVVVGRELARPRARGQEQRQDELYREIQRAGAFIAGRWYVWVENPYGRLSLRRTGLGAPGK